MKPALVIIDLQEVFLRERKHTSTYQSILGHINYALDIFHQADLPVIIIRDVYGEDGEDFKCVAELDLHEGDLHMTKSHFNAFYQSPLETLLSDLDVQSIVLAGMTAEYCIDATYFGGKDRGFNVCLLQGGVFASQEQALTLSYYTRDWVSCSALKSFI